MISAEHLSFSYGSTPVIEDLSFTLPDSGVFRFDGPSGCGKTTLLRLIADLERPNSGSITRQPNATVSMVFQENRLLPWLSAEENVAFVCGDSLRVERALKAVSLWDERHKFPEELSGGMQRRVAIARAIAYGGDILILDEPFTGLDEQLCQTIADTIYREFAEKLILLVTHSEEEARLFSPKTITLPCPLTGDLT
ncbi:MAG: ATP-binding cassette domain-containing protein [Clostridia bacterium]|nr:ATP-binding cassette domain-containing protein [Clostridia bacterium]